MRCPLPAPPQAFAQAVALQLFALRQARAAPELASAASAAGAGLTAAGAALAAYIRQLLGAAGTAAAAAESHALLQRCQATLSTAAAQEQALATRAEEGRAALAGVLAEAQPVAAQVLAALHECQVRAETCRAARGAPWECTTCCVQLGPATHLPCCPPHSTACSQAWQQRHDALLPLLLSAPPAALLAGPTAVDPSAAAAAGAAPPLLLVSAATPGGEAGAGSILHVALGMLPAEAPLSPSLLLRAAAVDTEGQRLLSERAAVAQQLAGTLQEYAAGVACLLGGPRYASSSQHAHWAAAFQAALDLPVPQVGAGLVLRLVQRHPALRPGGQAGLWLMLALNSFCRPTPRHLCRASSEPPSWRHAAPKLAACFRVGARWPRLPQPQPAWRSS